MSSSKPFQMYVPVLADQEELTYRSSVRTQDAESKC